MTKTTFIIVIFFSTCLLISKAQIIYTRHYRPDAPMLEELPLMDSLTQYEITWKFDKKVPVGKFITDDYYVVGPVTIVSITPAPEKGRNGSMLNGPTKYQSGYGNT